MKIDILVNVNKTIEDVWFHGVIQYKYNTYQKLGTEYWDNFCDWISGKSHSFFLDFYKPLLLKYSNLNHTCPYNGSVILKTDNISLQNFAFPQLVPAGRYQINADIYKGDRKTILCSATLYTSVSDHRVEIV